jgi:hypothetical protein
MINGPPPKFHGTRDNLTYIDSLPVARVGDIGKIVDGME